MLALRRPSALAVGRFTWTLIFALLAALTGASAAAGFVNGVGFTAFLVLAGWLVVYWRAGVDVLLVLACVDGFLKYLHGSVATFVLKDITVAVIVLGLSYYLATHPKALREQRWAGAWLVLAYVGFEAVEVFNPGGSPAAAVAGFRAHAFFCTLFFVGAFFLTSRKALTRTAVLAVGAITFACLVGIAQFVIGPAWTELGPGFLAASRHFVTEGTPGLIPVPGQSNMISRIYGTMVDPTSLGLAATFGIIYAAGALFAAKSTWSRILLGGAIFTMLVALLLSGTRAAIGAAAIGFFVFVLILAFRRETRRFVFVAVAMAVIAVPVGVAISGTSASQRFSSRSAQLALETRQRSAALVFASARQQPFGVGLGAAGAGGKYRKKQRGLTLAVDNLYLATLYETGPIGLGLLLTMQIGIFVLTLRAAYKATSVGVCTTFAGMGAAQIALLAAGTLNQGSLDYAPLAQMFWLFAGAITMPERFDDAPPAIVAPAAPQRVIPLRERFPKRLRALAGGLLPKPADAVREERRPITEAEIDAALDRFRAHLRANLVASAALGAFADRDGDELLRLASRKLFVELKKAMAAADADPASAEKARKVVQDSADVAALMLALSEKYEP
jgi:hypothetical protein